MSVCCFIYMRASNFHIVQLRKKTHAEHNNTHTHLTRERASFNWTVISFIRDANLQWYRKNAAMTKLQKKKKHERKKKHNRKINTNVHAKTTAHIYLYEHTIKCETNGAHFSFICVDIWMKQEQVSTPIILSLLYWTPGCWMQSHIFMQ